MTTRKKLYVYSLALISITLMLFSACNKDKAPVISTTEVTDITQTTAVSGGIITDDGGATVTAKGVCWSTNPNPTISDSSTGDGTGAGNFSSSISGLALSTKYYVRAYATNSAGTGYGNDLTFTTLAAIELPILTTKGVSEITRTTAISGGIITDDGGATVTARGVCWSTSQNPTISDSKTEDGTGEGSFSSNISGSEPNTKYYVRAYATNSAGTGYGDIKSFTTYKEDAVTDIDGNYYNIVTIGNLDWMEQNLRTTKYSDGTMYITTGFTTVQWADLTYGAYAIYPHAFVDGLNSDAETFEAYGALYNWYAVETGNLCPTGWRVPSDADWTNLTDYAGGLSIAGRKLKSTRTIRNAQPRWESLTTNATDEYGFAALPGGYRRYDGPHYYMGAMGIWWSSTADNATTAWSRSMSNSLETVYRSSYDKSYGFSVRCVRDN